MKVQKIYSIEIGECGEPLYYPNRKLLVYTDSDGSRLVCLNPYSHDVVFDNVFKKGVAYYPYTYLSCNGATRDLDIVLLDGAEEDYKVLHLDDFNLINIDGSGGYIFTGIEESRILTLSAWNRDAKEKLFFYDAASKDIMECEFDDLGRKLSWHIGGGMYLYQGFNETGLYSIGDLQLNFSKKSFDFDLNSFGSVITKGPKRSKKWEGVKLPRRVANYYKMGYVYLTELTDSHFIFNMCDYNDDVQSTLEIPIDDVDHLVENGIMTFHIDVSFDANGATYAIARLFDSVRKYDYIYFYNCSGNKLIDSKIGSRQKNEYSVETAGEYMAISGINEGGESKVYFYSLKDGSQYEIEIDSNEFIKGFEFDTLLMYNKKNGVLTAHEVVDE